MQTDPVFDPTRTSGFSTVSNPTLGLYCLTPSPALDPATHTWVASVEYARTGSGTVGTAQPDTGSCPPGKFAVRTLKFAPSPTPHWTPAWDVAFMVIVA